MASFDAGSIESSLHLDRSPFQRSLSAARAAAWEFARGSYEADIKGNINPLLGALRVARTSLQNFAREKYEATLGVEAAQAERRVNDFKQDLGEVARSRPTATVGANTAPGKRSLDGFDEVMRRYGRSWGQQGIRARVTADIRRAQTQLRLLERTVEGITDEDHRIRVQADITRTRQRLEALGRLATSLGMRSPTISVGLRGQLATAAQMVGLQRLADRLDGYNVRFRASLDDRVSRAIPNLLGALEMQVARYRTVMAAAAAVAMPLFYSSLAAIPAVASTAAGAIGSLAIAVGQGLAGGAGIAATALTQGLAGGISVVAGAAGLGGAALYAYGRVVSGTISYVGNLTKTIETQIDAVDDANKVLKEAKERLKAAKEGTEEYDNALKGVKLAQENARYEQERLNVLYDIATPRVLRLQRRVNEARIGMLRFGGALMHEVAPALITGMNEFGRFSGAVQSGALGMTREMTKATQEIIRAAAKGQNLASITTILQGIRTAGVPALNLVGNAALLAVNLLAPLVPHSLSVLRNLSGLATQANRWSQTEVGQRRIAEVWALLVSQGEKLGNIAWNTGRILFGLFAPATPYAQAFLSYLTRITNKAAEWVESEPRQSRIAATWQKLARRGQWLFRVATNLGAALWGVMVALEQSGTVDFMAESVLKITNRFRDFMSASGGGRTKIIEFMQDAEPILIAAASLAKEAADQFFRIAGEVISFRAEGEKLTVLEQIFKAIEDSLKPLADFLLYEFKKIGPLIGPLIEELADWFSTMAKSQPEMKAFIQLLTATLKFFNSLPEDTQRNIARMIAYVAAFKALGGGAAASGLATLAASVIQWRMLSKIYRGMPKMPPVVPPAAPVPSPAGPMRGGPGRVGTPPVIPAPVPEKGFWKKAADRIRRLPGAGAIATAVGWVLSRIGWRGLLRGGILVTAAAGILKGIADNIRLGKSEFAPAIRDALVETIRAPFSNAGVEARRELIKAAFNMPLVPVFVRWMEPLFQWANEEGARRWNNLGKNMQDGIIAGFKNALRTNPFTAPFVRIYEAMKKWWETESPSRKTMRLGRDIMRGLVEGIKQVPIIGPIIAKAQSLYQGASRAFRQGGWRGLGAWAVRQIGEGLRQTPLGGLVAKAQNVFAGAQQAFRRNGWRGLGAWAVSQIAQGLRQTPLGGLAARAQRVFAGAQQAFRRNGWRGLGAYAVNMIRNGLQGTPLGGLAGRVANVFQGASKAFRSRGWRGLGVYVVNAISGGLRGTRFYNFGVKVANFFAGAQNAFRRHGWRGLGAYVVSRISNGIAGTRLASLQNKLVNLYNSAANFINGTRWFTLGRNIVIGIINGLNSADFGTRLHNMAVNAWNRVVNFFNTRSPSRRMMWLGDMLARGLAGGITKNAHRAVSAALDMARKVAAAAQIRVPAGAGSPKPPAPKPPTRTPPVVLPKPPVAAPPKPPPAVQPPPVTVAPVIPITLHVKDADAAEEEVVEAVREQIRAAMKELQHQAAGSTAYIAGEVM